MDIDQNPRPHDDRTIDRADADHLHDVPASMTALVRAIGVRLRAPLPTRRRDELAHELAAAATGAAQTVRTDASFTPAAPSHRVASEGPMTSGPAGRGPGHGRPALRSRLLQRASVVTAALVVLAGAVGVLSRSADDLPVIVLAAGPSAGAAGAMDAAGLREGMTEPALGDMMWWTPTVYRFVLADGVDLAAGQAPAWRLVRPADLAAAAAPIAATLGLPALRPSEWDADALAVESPSAGNLWVAPSGDWYYSGPSDLWPVWDCAIVDGTDGAARDGAATSDGATGPSSVEECTAPEPPAGVPGADRARVLAAEFLATVGHRDVRILDVWVDEWGAWVTAEPTGGGVPSGSGLMVSVGFGGQERVTSANGTLATVERIGEYPTIDAAAAVLRLQEDLNAWQLGGPVARPLPADAGGAVPYVDGRSAGQEGGQGGSGDGSIDPDAPVSDADTPVTILPVPDQPMPGTDGEVEPVELTVTIVAIERVTSLVWTATGEMLLLPHYRLVDSDGGWWTVVAVADRYLAR